MKINNDFETARKKFNKANKARKRVMIAKDVLAQLDAKRFKAKQGYWVKPDNKGERFKHKSEQQEVCDLVSGKCQVCGIGALFVSAVTFADKLKVQELTGVSNRDLEPAVTNDGVAFLSDSVFDYLSRFFDDDQLNKIETAFENGHGHCFDVEAESFWANLQDVPEPELRMRLIMQNIISNKGYFDASRRPKESILVYTPGYDGP